MGMATGVMWWPVVAAALVLVSAARVPEARGAQPDALSVSQPGDIMLGGLFPIHEKGEKTPCGHKVYYRGLQRLEAMMFAVDQINRNESILPGITLGVNILDTCSRDTYALNQSLQFIKSSLNNLDSSIFECPNTMVVPRIKKGYNNTGPVFGVVGGSYSSVSLQVANLLRLFHIPQISPASTAKALSDKTRFDYFARTVPPDTFQSIALVDIVKMFNWSYVSTVHSEGSYGEYGIEAFHREAQDRGVCIATAEKVTSDADDRIFDQIITKLKKKENAKGVILFTRAEDARGILQAARRAGVYEQFHFVASDGWGKQHKLVEGLEDVAEGAITVELQSNLVPEFDKYMKSLTPDNNLRNPWFQEYWQDTFGCLLENNYPLIAGGDSENRVQKVCDPNLRLSEQVGYEQESKVQFVVDAVYAFALALHNLHRDVCKNYRGKGVCSEMMSYDGGEFYKRYLLNVSFTDLAGSEVKFDSQGDGLARYDILNYQRVGNSSTYQYRKVGKWFNELQLNLEDVVWNQDLKAPPSSACSLPCDDGMIKKQQGDTCCWICDKCEEYEYVLNASTCADCGHGRWPDASKQNCYPLQVHVMQWDTVFVIIPVTVSLVGIVLTCAVLFIYIKHNDTPLIRASGRELSYLLLGGILLCYTNTFLLIAVPTMFTCVAQRFLVGTGFSTIYGSLFTKTNRISRIFNSAGHTAKRPSYISPKSQVIITVGLVGVQILLSLIWMIVEPAGTRYHYPDRKTVILKCKMSDMSFLFSQLYNIMLVTICTVYAFKTRKIPENFNESKFIGFTMYTTCVVWLSFIPIYFSTGHSYEMQITTQCIVVSLSATVALACLYGPKCYIIIFHPDKNVRKLTMNSAAYKKHALPGASSTGGTNIVPDSESPAHGAEGSESIPMTNVTACNTPSRSSVVATAAVVTYAVDPEAGTDNVALL